MPDPSVSPADTIRGCNATLRYAGGNEIADRSDAALDALLAVGERDKAEIERLTTEIAEVVNALLALIPAVMLDTKEHERLVWAVGVARAVLADKEDAGQRDGAETRCEQFSYAGVHPNGSSRLCECGLKYDEHRPEAQAAEVPRAAGEGDT